jgi:hypothetical protein
MLDEQGIDPEEFLEELEALGGLPEELDLEPPFSIPDQKKGRRAKPT